ncbi:phosphate starvation-inducible protein PhoH [Acetobacter estunensis NRIC 0472]|uniref:PhoH-like protein n=1 Tax=Acetobacter estunensis TaxID=104097 RepID=A0A967B8G1_9PROT|nr:AAA family ATPase [Acetobacter estunensis]GBQ20707.1 phosphate starvation-inducible protein PhoH [Acetobacter estunensis NRIC 0472]
MTQPNASPTSHAHRGASHLSGKDTSKTTTLQFGDNALLAQLVGDRDRHLRHMEEALGIKLACRGNRIAITGQPGRTALAHSALTTLYRKLERGTAIDTAEIDAAIRLSDIHAALREQAPAEAPAVTETPPRSHGPRLLINDLPAIRTRRGAIEPRSPGQAAYMEMLARNEMVFGVGPAGTGKTYLAVAQAVAMLQSGQVDRIVLSRPAVEAGERLGFLPGDMKDKIDPYLRPLYDALHDMMPGEQVTRRMATGDIEVAPLAFMRGRTLAHAYVILDEAQNTTPAQMKMFLTRMGNGTRMVVTGDLSQVDLPSGTTSGLRDALETLEGVQGIAVNRFDANDVVRHRLVARIVEAYDDRKTAERESSHNSRFRRENNGTAQ